MIKITEEHIETLVEGVVDSWDMDTLIDYVKERLREYYVDLTAKEIVNDWKQTFGDDFPNK